MHGVMLVMLYRRPAARAGSSLPRQVLFCSGSGQATIWDTVPYALSHLTYTHAISPSVQHEIHRGRHLGSTMPPKPAPIFSQPSPVIPRHPNHQHDIVTALVAVETLDTLPGDLTKTFGDLRELDAVLNSTTASLTHKLRSLTRALQSINPDINPGWGLPHTNPKASEQLFTNAISTTPQNHTAAMSIAAASHPPETFPSRPLGRFRSLLEIAEELTRYKIGVEDKVRVSGQACDTVSPMHEFLATQYRPLTQCFFSLSRIKHIFRLYWATLVYSYPPRRQIATRLCMDGMVLPSASALVCRLQPRE
jgi:hypothetical protein